MTRLFFCCLCVCVRERVRLCFLECSINRVFFSWQMRGRRANLALLQVLFGVIPFAWGPRVGAPKEGSFDQGQFGLCLFFCACLILC